MWQTVSQNAIPPIRFVSAFFFAEIGATSAVGIAVPVGGRPGVPGGDLK